MAKAWVEDLWHKKTGAPSERCRQHKSPKPYRSSVHGQGARWQVRGYDDEGGRLPKENYEAYEDAATRAENLSGNVRSGKHRQEQTGRITLERYIWDVYWPNVQLPPGQRERKEQLIRSCILAYPIGHLELAGIGPEELNAWKTALRSQVGVNSVRRSWYALSKVLQGAFEAGRIDRNPCRGLDSARPPKEPPSNKHAWSSQRVREVRQALPPRWRVTDDLGFGGGLRQGEAFGVSPEDFDFETGHLSVVRQLQSYSGRMWFKLPKEDKTRRFPIPAALCRSVKDHMEQFPPVKVTLPWVRSEDPEVPWDELPRVTVELLVVTAYGNPVTAREWNRDVWKPSLEQAGVLKRLYREDGTPRKAWEDPEGGNTYHVLRDTFASVHLAAGETPATVAAWMGDTVETVYRYYAHWIRELSGAGLRTMDQWLGSPS
ncbi:tyrosine-type recombinase/integrase [Streptomyces hesseae]|uniref:Tyr recombinase domain-containing protein n=1 Tax=Streptomyces hesseae TaxID=3075519 RepID=A0ABU2SM09_9ACTN|nr:hypothetical protein [Streptomyces sp. DSM 40473]MDT0449932.1 hypothetical protein [Streptomyces sp. DSM 40473]